MKLSYETYKEKVKGCFLGKNIGGTIGAPFEGKRGLVDVDYYTHDLSKGVLPNDDLDLQLLWLSAARVYGKALTSDVLAEYWIGYNVADWAEYGVSKNNMKAGLPVGIANRYNNPHKDSCGCFIRSEIWACLAPGRPEIAVKYAYEDAVLDHADEGLFGEIFCAAVESAAFIESDIRKLIDIGLSYIPKNSALALGINTAVECYDKGLTWKETYKKIMQTVPGAFGRGLGQFIGERDPEIPDGEVGFDAPSNIAIATMALVYSGGDFSKAVCIASSCCEDADCTAGTAGAILGIIGTDKIIDEKWLVPIGDEIKTISIDRTKPVNEHGERVPTTVTELTKRIMRTMPTFMQDYFDAEEMTLKTSDNLYDHKILSSYDYSMSWCERIELRNRGMKRENSLIEAVIIPDGGFEISQGEEKTIEFHFESKAYHHLWIDISVDFPSEWECSQKETSVTIYDTCQRAFRACTNVKFTPAGLTKTRYDIPVTIQINGRFDEIHTKLVLFVKR